MSKTTRMPCIFFGHGSPMNALQQNRYTDAWQQIGASLPKPTAILCVSAHWYIPGTAVTAMPSPRTIHDFGGFPQELFDIQYPAQGDPQLAVRVQQLLKPIEVRLDQSWGLDHGAWSVLVHAYPAADVPVVQLSIDANLSAESHYELAKRLTPLRMAGVLIIGSGNVVHNLGRMQWTDDATPFDWATDFNEQMHRCLADHDHLALINYTSLGDAARLSVPTPEHYLPLLYVLAQQEQGENMELAVDGIEYGSIGMLTAVVGAGSPHQTVANK